MGITSLTSREFNQDAARAKKAALHGPVFITDRGRPAHVLLSIEEYQRLIGKGPTLADMFADKDGGGDFDFDPPKLNIGFRPAEFGED
ncbi:type II toxin-antitoxin system Phd/YefM family antitoxin [Sphingomonas trueperi]|uniref:type II toxin-antitoxin system Phd/YefM family antitoxin n=1 Tax=Sphingomonas trueperi TaxID=53317 RepID=UPI000EB58160